MRRATIAALVAAAVVATPAGASTWVQLGLVDTQEALGDQARFGRTLGTLRPQVVRIMLGWGGPFGVARERRPEVGTDPADPAYNWGLYDQAVLTATSRGVRVLFTIYGSPAWSNLYQPANVPPQNFTRLKEFAYAAALRYSGSYRRPDGVVLPRVSLWTAWNEPNIPLGLKPQWRRLGGRWVIHSAWAYARICNAVYDGIHLSLLRGQQVACGVTTARGNNAPGTRRPSVAPIGFLRATKAAGLRNFDAYAHHPYSGDPRLAPGTKPKNPRAITLGNIQKLINEVTRLYGQKPIWITEYGYETSPPDRIFGVRWEKQALYLREAYGIARRNPRIQMLLWFLARDEARSNGWQSGFLSAAGRRKPSFYEFQSLAGVARKRQLQLVRSVRGDKTEGLTGLLRGVVGADAKEDSPRSWLPVGPLLAGS
jgi:Glycosyl hydrolase catalytic core